MYSAVIKSPNDVLWYLRNEIVIIDVPNLILEPTNTLLQSNTLKISVRTIIDPNTEIITFVVTIGKKEFNLTGVILERGADYVVGDYPQIRNLTFNPYNVNVVIPEGKYSGFAFVFEEQDVKYTFVRSDFTWYFFLAVERVPKKIESTGGPNTITQFQQPEIFVISQLLIDDSDIGNTLFEVKNNGIIQKYEKYCPKIVSVLKGIGLTAYDKLSYIYKTEYIYILGLKFLYNMIEYSMVRYLLSKLLYGKFNVKYLLDKYYIKFIEDLKNSEYKNFVNYFIDPNSKVYNYNKYFICNF